MTFSFPASILLCSLYTSSGSSTNVSRSSTSGPKSSSVTSVFSESSSASSLLSLLLLGQSMSVYFVFRDIVLPDSNSYISGKYIAKSQNSSKLVSPSLVTVSRFSSKYLKVSPSFFSSGKLKQ